MKTVKTTVQQRLLLSLGLAAGIVALASLPAAHHVSYIRYTSPPLSDGTRYTFLRPTYLAGVSVEFGNKDSLIQFVHFFPIHSDTSFLEDQMPRQLKVLFPSHGDEVAVEVGNAAKGYYFSRSTLSSVPEEHTEDHGVKGGFTYHNVYADDEKAGLSFHLQHSAGMEQDHQTDARSLADFQCSDATITSSFRILPPGVSAPSP